MNIIDEIIEWFDEEEYEYAHPDEIVWDFKNFTNDDCVEIEEIKTESLEQHRWYIIKRTIYKIEDEYFAIYFNAPSTEVQEGQTTNPKIVKVEPYEVKVTKYKKIK